MLTTLLAGLALSGPPPCEAFTRPDTLEGEHFWIEWDPSVGDPVIAQQNLDWAEEARRVYTEELGYDFPTPTILIRLEDSSSGGGLTTTVACPDGTLAPHITLFATAPGIPGQNTTMHEVVHAVQYAYMGSYLDSINSWPWWMEGCATWMAYKADGDLYEQLIPAHGYLAAPWLGLHQTPFAYADPIASRYLYGTVLIALHMERGYGPEAIRATWEYGADLSGEQIFFPDAVEAAGIDFHDFWLDFMAEVAVLDVPDASYFSEGLAVEERVVDMPSFGSPSEDTRPQGLGLSAVHFRKSAGSPGRALVVNFEGDPEVDWLGVLARTKGKGPGGKVLETVELVVDAKGKGTARLEDFDGSRDALLVVSPVSQTLEGHDYSWTADLVAPSEPEEKKGCGCESAPTAPAAMGWLGLLGLLGLRRRERRTGSR